MYIYVYISYIHTHIHRYIHIICMYKVCVCVCVCVHIPERMRAGSRWWSKTERRAAAVRDGSALMANAYISLQSPWI